MNHLLTRNDLRIASITQFSPLSVARSDCSGKLVVTINVTLRRNVLQTGCPFTDERLQAKLRADRANRFRPRRSRRFPACATSLSLENRS